MTDPARQTQNPWPKKASELQLDATRDDDCGAHAVAAIRHMHADMIRLLDTIREGLDALWMQREQEKMQRQKVES